eukprot:COSAG02_NODE_206_length_29144_cov_12.855121_32_plen_33_part_00
MSAEAATGHEHSGGHHGHASLFAMGEGDDFDM